MVDQLTAPALVGPSPSGGGPVPSLTRQPVLLRIMTPRRLEILRLAANGNTNADIARVLVLSEETVKTHMRKIHGVLGARDRAHAVALGMARGFVRPCDVVRRSDDEY